MVVERTVQRSLAGVMLALVLSTMLAHPAAALTWAPSVGVAADTAAAWAPALVATGPQSAAAIFRETVAGAPVIRVARTIDRGATWLAPVTISSPDAAAVTRATVAASGQIVDAVWSQGADCFAGHCEIRYARSSDGGATFGPSVRLSSAKGMAGQAAVARSGSQVIVAWTDAPSGKVMARVSTDGGTTFEAAVRLDTTTNKQYPNGGAEAFPVLAWCGTDVLSAGMMTRTRLVARRSSDGGRTWTAPMTLAKNAAPGIAPSAACQGMDAVLAYGRQTSGVTWLAYRRSSDRGATWKAAAVLAPSTAMAADAPVISAAGTMFLALFLRCSDAACTAGTGGAGATYLRTSTTRGATWSAPEQVASTPQVIHRPVGLGYVGAYLALFSSLRTTTWASNLEARRGY